MPKETIYGSELPWGEDHPAVAVAQVLWSREAEHVQLVTKAIHRADHSDVTPPGIERKEGDILFTDGMYVNLDRRGINELIRDLRRARVQAFGRDE
jgi:hypothetical protein